MKKISKRTWIVVVVILVLAVAGGLFWRSKATQSGENDYQTVSVERGNLVATVGATGTVRSKQEATLAWQTSGTVESVNAALGDRVAKDLTLAVLEKTSLPSSVILAEADLASAQQALDDLLNSDTAAAQARVALRVAEDALEKAEDYRNSLDEPYKYEQIVYNYVNGVRVPRIKTISVDEADEETKAEADQDLALRQAEYDDALRAWERVKDGPSQVDIEAAQARVDAAQATLNMARLTAPFEGTITQVNVMAGDQVNAGMVAFRIDDLSSLLVDVELSEVDINSVSLGQMVTLSFDAILDQEYQGKIIEVGRVGNDIQGAVNFKVTVELDQGDDQVRPGMTAAVNIVVKEIKDEILIPNRAVRLVDGERVVYLLKNGTPEMVEVRLGASDESMSVVVSDTLEVGDKVILNPPSNFSMADGPPGSGHPGGN